MKIRVVLLYIFITLFIGCDNKDKNAGSDLQKEISYEKKVKELFLKNNLSESEKEAKKMLKKYPKNEAAFNILGLLNLRKNNLDDAEYYLKKAIEYHPESATVHCNLSSVYYAKKKYKKAIYEMELALKYDPDSIKYLMALGYYYVRIGKTDKGINLTKKVLKYDPKNIKAFHRLGNYYLIERNKEKTFKYLNLALKHAPNDGDIINDIIEGYYIFGEQDKALVEANKRINNNVAVKDDYTIAALCYYNKKEFAKAKEYLEIIFRDIDLETNDRISRNDLSYYSLLGILYLKQGEVNNSEKIFNEIHRFDPSYSATYYGLGKIYLKKQDYSKAKKYLEQYLELKDNDEEYINDAKQILNKIYNFKIGKAVKLNEAA